MGRVVHAERLVANVKLKNDIFSCHQELVLVKNWIASAAVNEDIAVIPVSYSDKDIAKRVLNAKWNANTKSWYVPTSTIQQFIAI